MQKKRVIKARDVMHTDHLELDGLATGAEALEAMIAADASVVIVKKRHEHDAYRHPAADGYRQERSWRKTVHRSGSMSTRSCPSRDLAGSGHGRAPLRAHVRSLRPFLRAGD